MGFWFLTEIGGHGRKGGVACITLTIHPLLSCPLAVGNTTRQQIQSSLIIGTVYMVRRGKAEEVFEVFVVQGQHSLIALHVQRNAFCCVSVRRLNSPI